VSFGYFLGEKWHEVYMYSHRYILPAVLVAIVILLIAIYWKTAEGKQTDPKCGKDNVQQL
jgi:membrane protein DedA with SNARE-associated domain